MITVIDLYAVQEWLQLVCDDLTDQQAEQIAYALEDNPEAMVKMLGWEVVDDVQSAGVHGPQPE